MKHLLFPIAALTLTACFPSATNGAGSTAPDISGTWAGNFKGDAGTVPITIILNGADTRDAVRSGTLLFLQGQKLAVRGDATTGTITGDDGKGTRVNLQGTFTDRMYTGTGVIVMRAPEPGRTNSGTFILNRQ